MRIEEPIVCPDQLHITKQYAMFYNELNRVYKKLSSVEISKLFRIKYKGYEFNCLPFLLSGSAYYPPEYRSALTTSVAIKDPSFEPFDIDLLYRVENLDFAMFGALYPALSDLGIRAMAAYHFRNYPKEVARMLFSGAVAVFEQVIFVKESMHHEYKYTGICNTQAFCYYLSILWLLSQSPLLYSFATRDLRRIKFDELLDRLCPEESIHFQYIKGELSAKELCEKYISRDFSDGSSIVLREIMSNASDGKYGGEDIPPFNLSLLIECYDQQTQNEEYRLNEHLAYCFLFDGTYKQLTNEARNNALDAEQERAKSEQYKNRLNTARQKASDADRALQDKTKEVTHLKSTLNSTKTDEELKKRVDELIARVNELEAENNSLFSERMELKQSIRSLTKELKRAVNGVVDEEDEREDVSVEVDLPQMIKELADKRFVILGADDISHLDKSLQDIGLKYVSRFVKTWRKIGVCDYVVIFTSRCAHDDVYKCEKLIKGKSTEMIYYNGTSVEGMVKHVYEWTRR